MIPDTTATEPDYPDPNGEHDDADAGSLNADGDETTECHFEYGTEKPGSPKASRPVPDWKC